MDGLWGVDFREREAVFLEQREYTVTEIRTETAIIRLRRPVLTPEEYQRQLDKICAAAVRAWEATQRKMAQKERKS